MNYTFLKEICMPFFFLLILTIPATSQSLTPKEIAYQKMFDDLLESDLADTLKLAFFGDSLAILDYRTSTLPFEYGRKGIALAEAADHSFWKGRMKANLGLLYSISNL